MSTPPAGVPDADWLSWPAGARQLILAQQKEIQALRQENDELRNQLTALATELANLRERIGRSSRNPSKPPSSNGPGFKPPERRKGSGRKRGGQPGHPGSGPEPLPIERVDEVMEHQPDACRRCGMLLAGEDPEPLRHQVIEIPPITPVFDHHRLHRMGCRSADPPAAGRCGRGEGRRHPWRRRARRGNQGGGDVPPTCPLPTPRAAWR